MTTVATYGVFDLFHQGHDNLLRRARNLGDRLIVGVTTNQFDELRGKLNTVQSLETRMQSVRDSGYADLIIAEEYPNQKADDIKRYGIDILVAGSDWEGKFDYLKELCKVVYLPRTEGISSSALRDAVNARVRLGIVGSGRIAARFSSELPWVSGADIHVVYNPHIESAQKLADSLYHPHVDRVKATDSWDELMDAVDAVYIASPHQYHYEQAKIALQMGKHVLCEKPMALSRAHAQELFEIALEKDLILLEAIKTAYCPGFAKLIEVAQSGVIGDICDIEAAFTRIPNFSKRECVDLKYEGGFLEYGNYCMLPAVRLLGAQRFESLSCDIYQQKMANGLDRFTKATLSDDSVSVLVKTGLGVKSEGQLLVSGTNGYILAPAPWWMTKRFEVHHEDPDDVTVYEAPYFGDGLRYEISNFVHLIHQDEDRTPKLLAEESIAFAGVVEKFLAAR